LAGSVPALRLALDPAHRRQVPRAFAALWASAHAYARGGGGLPWRAALALVTLPAGALFLSNNRTLGTGDSWPVVPTACSLVTEGNWEIGEFLADVPEV